MNILVRQKRTGKSISQSNRLSGLFITLLWFLFFASPSELVAQDQVADTQQPTPAEPKPPEEEVVVTVSLPDSQQMAMALATPGLRMKALVDLAVAANVLSRADDAVIDMNQSALAQSFLDDRAWLQMLIERYGWAQPRSAVLDPAAWLVLKDLQQNNLDPMALALPDRTPMSVLIYQVFQRAGQQLAVANVPVLLLEVEADVFKIWDAFLQLTTTGDTTDAAWKMVETTWFTDRQMPIPQLPDPTSVDHEPLIEDIPGAMSRLVLSAVDVRPPDSRGLMQLRYSMLSDIPAEGEDILSRDLRRDTLYLVSMIDGLHDGHYFEFIQGLLSLTSRLLELSAFTDEATSETELLSDTETPSEEEQVFSLVDWLVTELPPISNHYAVDFARVDPHFNTAMSSAYDVLLKISASNDSSPISEALNINALRLKLADSVAQLALLIPDMGYYFNAPVRANIVNKINACITAASSLDETSISTMTRSQFDGCMESLLTLAQRETRLAELSGDINGPFRIDTLRRELSVTPWQRINYGVGYLHENYLTDCQPPADALPNPLEWAVLATTMTWFAEYFPDFFNSAGNETRLTQMRSIGDQLILDLAEQSGCLTAIGSSINDPVIRTATDYELALRALDDGIKNAEADFRKQRLSLGADVSLEQNAEQNTSYRPDDLVITPCDTQNVCEMSGELSTTRALIGLFPDEYLVAEQTGMGRIEICYHNMEWVERRSELVRADDENVANYFGHLGFDLMGRYVENGVSTDIFGFRFTSPQEHHYLFAEATGDVLDDSCPVEWVGTRVVTQLPKNRGGIVPNRLTYLAASRILPSRLLQNNWDRGAEWRDWFVTGIGVTRLELSPAEDIEPRLNLHLQSLYQAGQTEIYQRILLSNARNSEGDVVSLFNEMSQVSIAKSMMRMQLMLFYPQSLFNSDKIRMAIVGDAGLLEGRTLRRFRADNVAMESVNKIALERLNNFREDWLNQPEAVRRQGSVSASLMHALTRINILYRQFFTSRPEPLQEVEVTAPPTD